MAQLMMIRSLVLLKTYPKLSRITYCPFKRKMLSKDFYKRQIKEEILDISLVLVENKKNLVDYFYEFILKLGKAILVYIHESSSPS